MGMLPVATIHHTIDVLMPAQALPALLTDIAHNIFAQYDMAMMHSLPIAVQVTGHHLKEERMLAGMHVMQDVLHVL